MKTHRIGWFMVLTMILGMNMPLQAQQTPATGAAAAKPAAAKPAAAKTKAKPAVAAKTKAEPDAAAADKKVASVNGTVIGRQQLDKELASIQRRMAQQGNFVPQTAMEEMRARVLDELIGQELLYQDSRKQGIQVDEKEIQGQLGTMQEKFNDHNAFKEALAASGLSVAQLTDRLRQQAAIRQLVERQILPAVSVPDGAADTFYNQNPQFFTRPEQVRARHILIRTGEGADDAAKAEARKRLSEIRDQVVGGGDFAALARMHSEDPGSKEKGGDLGFFTRGRMVKAFEEAAFALSPNQVSDLVPTQYGYHLIQVTERKAAGTVALEEVKPRILDHLKQQQIRERLEDYVKTLRKGAKVEKFI